MRLGAFPAMFWDLAKPNANYPFTQLQRNRVPSPAPPPRFAGFGTNPKNSLPCNHVLVNHTTLHHKAYVFQCAHILQRIGGDGDDVCVLPCLDCAYILCATNQVGSAGCGRMDSLCRGEAKLDHIEELFGVVTVRI